MRLIQCLVLASCLGLVANVALADGGIIVGDDGGLGGGGEVNEDPTGDPGDDVVSGPGMIAMDATERHLLRALPGRLPASAMLVREQALARSAHGHEVVDAVRGDGLSGQDVRAVATTRPGLGGAPSAFGRGRRR